MKYLLRGALLTGMMGVVGLPPAHAADKMIVGLVTKTAGNPFFIKLKDGAQAKAKELGIDLRSFSGRADDDTQSQIAAIDTLIAAGAKGILLTPADSLALLPSVEKARKAGLMVVVMDSPLTPASAADATFATDNFKAGTLIGEWAAKAMGTRLSSAKIAMLDLSVTHPAVDVARDKGFLKGLGIDIKDAKVIGNETDPRIVGHDVTNGTVAGGKTAMESLLATDPGINLVYTINEPAAAGAYAALKAIGKDEDTLIVSVDGGCSGVRNIKSGQLGATSMQFPLLMASQGVEAVVKFATTGQKPANTAGLDFIDTGAELVTDHPVAGVPSMSSDQALTRCWG